MAEQKPQPERDDALAAQRSADLGSLSQNPHAIAAATSATTDLQSAMVLARRFPRDELGAFERAAKTAKRASFAERAEYSYQRAAKTVRGPSVYLARELARVWGNIQYGVDIVGMDEGAVHIRGWAFDLETNARVTAEAKFGRLIYRKKKGWVEPDERDLRELVNKQGALAVRNCLLQIMPSDLVETIVKLCRDTKQAAARGDLSRDREGTIRSMLLAFQEFDVSLDMIEEFLGHDAETMSAEELEGLRSVWNSIKDGNTRREDHFNVRRNGTADTKATAISLEDLAAKIKPKAAEPEGEAESEEEIGETTWIDRLQEKETAEEPF